MLFLGNVYVSWMSEHMEICSWYYREKGAGDWVMHMGIRLHCVVIIFLVILFMGGFFGWRVIIAGVCTSY